MMLPNSARKTQSHEIPLSYRARVAAAKAERNAFWKWLLNRSPHAHVTTTLVMINIVLFGLTSLASQNIFTATNQALMALGANWGPFTGNHQWWRVLTSTYLHVGLIHLLGNLWALVEVGMILERFIGASPFFLVYTVTGIVGSLCGLYFHGDLISVGASGGILGIASFLLTYLIINQSFLALPSQVFTRLFSSQLFLLLNGGIFSALNNPKVDLAGHVGGLLSGVLLAVVLGAASSDRLAANIKVAMVGLLAFALGLHFIGSADNMVEATARLDSEYNTAIRELKGLNAPITDSGLNIKEVQKRFERQIFPKWRAEIASAAQTKQIAPWDRKFFSIVIDYNKSRLHQVEELTNLLFYGRNEKELDLATAEVDRLEETLISLSGGKRGLSAQEASGPSRAP